MKSRLWWVLFMALSCASTAAFANDEEFPEAYINVDQYNIESADKYFTRHQGRNYYTSGKKNGFRVQENNEESTDETIGIVTFLIAPASIIYMNLEGWWD